MLNWENPSLSGGQSTFFGLLNTNIHIIMYFYYTVAAMGPKYHKYLWWKRYLTTMQIVSLQTFHYVGFDKVTPRSVFRTKPRSSC